MEDLLNIMMGNIEGKDDESAAANSDIDENNGEYEDENNEDDIDGMNELLSMFNGMMGRTSNLKSAKIENARQVSNNRANNSNSSNISNNTMSNNTNQINVVLCHEDALPPTSATSGSAGYDLYACEDTLMKAKTGVCVRTGVIMEIPEGYVGLVNDRSSYAVKFNIFKGAGVIDSDYRGEIMVFLYNHSDNDKLISVGERFAQILIMPISKPVINVIKYTDLTETERGGGGFGSTGTH